MCSLSPNLKLDVIIITILSLMKTNFVIDISPSSDSLFQLLTIFVSAKLAAYVKFYQNNKDFIDSLGK